MKINESQLRKIIRHLIRENLNKPMLERDDIGNFFVVTRPNGGEKLEELMFETNISDYANRIGDRQVAALVKSEGRARRLATNLRQGKINELASMKQQEINAKLKEIKETQALMGAMSHYFKLKEGDPTNNKKWGQYQETLKQQQAELAELKKHKKEIEEGRIPANLNTQGPQFQSNVQTGNIAALDQEDTVNIDLSEAIPKIGQPSSAISRADTTNKEEDVVNSGLKEAQPKIPTPSSPNQKSHLSFQKDDVNIAGLKETKKKKPSSGLSKKKKSAIAKKAHKGGDIGKKGKNFKKVAAKAAKEYGSEEAGKRVAGAALWKNVKR